MERGSIIDTDAAGLTATPTGAAPDVHPALALLPAEYPWLAEIADLRAWLQLMFRFYGHLLEPAMAEGRLQRPRDLRIDDLRRARDVFRDSIFRHVIAGPGRRIDLHALFWSAMRQVRESPSVSDTHLPERKPASRRLFEVAALLILTLHPPDRAE